MAPKNRKQADISPTSPASVASPQKTTPSTPSQSTRSSTSTTAKNSNDAQAIIQGVWENYLDKTPQRTKLIDAFMVFLVVVGVLQFVYCVIVGNYVSEQEDSIDNGKRSNC